MRIPPWPGSVPTLPRPWQAGHLTSFRRHCSQTSPTGPGAVARPWRAGQELAGRRGQVRSVCRARQCQVPTRPAQGRGTAGSPSCCPRLLPAAGRERLVLSQGEGGGSTRPESRARNGDFRLYPEWPPQPSLVVCLRAAAHSPSPHFASFADNSTGAAVLSTGCAGEEQGSTSFVG